MLRAHYTLLCIKQSLPLRVKSFDSMGMFFNNAACDVYIGKGAGKKLLHDIDEAKHSVQILSPFLSPFLIKKLIHLHRKGIKITLITTVEIEDFFWEWNIHQLILQDRQLNAQAEAQRDQWKFVVKRLN